jgi:RimJ/RimL family protein N-acetyltransferase
MHFRDMDKAACYAWFLGSIAHSQLQPPDAYNWAITWRDDPTLIGWLGIGAASHPRYRGERDFGYVLHKHLWNQGIMREALQAVLAFEFDTLGTPWITATHSILNPASGRVMRAVGMRYSHTIADTDAAGMPSAEACYVIQNPAHHPKETP